MLLCGGDLNRMREGEIRYYIDPTDQANSLANPSLHANNSSLEINAWNALLSQLIEIETSPHSHYSKAGNFESRIDRLWWSVPPWLSRLLAVHKPVFQPAHAFN